MTWNGWNALSVGFAAAGLAAVIWAMAWCTTSIDQPPTCGEDEHPQYDAVLVLWHCVDNE